MHHGIRGDEADADAAFVEALAARLGLRVHRKHVDAPAMAHTQSIGLEEAARSLRYGWFAEMLASGAVDAVATAHTLNDQAETVLHKLIRGAWTEGLSGIHPILKPEAAPAGLILRPLLGATREQIVAWLGSIDQPWREDASNSDISYTRNRIRHQLLIQLATFNPRIAQQLAQVATIARDEEAYWQKEVERLLPDLLLPGRAVRGGGRATSTMPGERSLAIEVERLRGLHPALMRRLLRAAARELGFSLDFEQTARLLALVQGPANTRREQLTGELRAERTPRELRLLSAKQPGASLPSATAAVEIPVPGEGEGFGWRIRCSLASPSAASQSNALLRAAIPNDRVQLRYSRGAPKRIKEVFERMGIPPDQRAGWPVLIWRGEIVWMQGAVLEPSPVSLAIRLLTDRLR
jgi:tRNA(Ile)-lysidine synthase